MTTDLTGKSLADRVQHGHMLMRALVEPDTVKIFAFVGELGSVRFDGDERPVIYSLIYSGIRGRALSTPAIDIRENCMDDHILRRIQEWRDVHPCLAEDTQEAACRKTKGGSVFPIPVSHPLLLQHYARLEAMLGLVTYLEYAQNLRIKADEAFRFFHPVYGLLHRLNRDIERILGIQM